MWKSFTKSQKNANFESSTIHLVGVDMLEISYSILITEKYFYMIEKRIHIFLFAVETLGSSFTWFRRERNMHILTQS